MSVISINLAINMRSEIRLLGQGDSICGLWESGASIFSLSCTLPTCYHLFSLILIQRSLISAHLQPQWVDTIFTTCNLLANNYISLLPIHLPSSIICGYPHLPKTLSPASRYISSIPLSNNSVFLIFLSYTFLTHKHLAITSGMRDSWSMSVTFT